MRIVLLGGSGFLGQKMQLTLSSHDLLIPQRKTAAIGIGKAYSSEKLLSMVAEIEAFRPHAVLNLMAAWGNVSETVLWQSNHLVPLAIARALDTKNISWLQIGSSLQNYFDHEGVDYDTYSMLKRFTLEELQKLELRHLVELRLPMLLGQGSRPQGLVATLAQALRDDELVEISTGNEVLPVRHVCDVAYAVGVGIEELLEGPPKRYVPPAFQMTVSQIITEMERQSGRAVRLKRNSELDRPIRSNAEHKFVGKSLFMPIKRGLEEIFSEYL